MLVEDDLKFWACVKAIAQNKFPQAICDYFIAPTRLLGITDDHAKIYLASDWHREFWEKQAELIKTAGFELFGADMTFSFYSADTLEPEVETATQMPNILESIEITNNQSSSGFCKLSELIEQSYDEIERLSKLKTSVTRISTGYPSLDSMTSGLQKGELIILASCPAMGKTSLALNIASNVGKLGHTVAIFSPEMASRNFCNRMISSEGLIETDALVTGKLSDDDWGNLLITQGELADTNIYIVNTPMITITEIQERSRKLAQEQGSLGLIVIDSLQSISGTGKKSRQQELSEVCQQLKNIAQELEVPILVLSQVSRDVEYRDDKRPRISDLCDSTSIEPYADMIIFIHRDAYYQMPVVPDVEVDNKAEIIFAKNWSGEIGTVELMWIGKFAKFMGFDYGTKPSPSFRVGKRKGHRR
ncbi:hypothetical protein RyT2_02390 [Pseudolactococcus yaeyamensis]